MNSVKTKCRLSRRDPKSLGDDFMSIRKQLSKCSIVTGTAFVIIMGFAVLTRGEENITNSVQMVIKVAFMGKAVSNELVRISQDEGISSNIRQLASDALQNHDTSGTNTYEEIESFVTNWTMTNEPAMTSNTIAVMKDSLELGISAFGQLADYASDTNTPLYLRSIAGQMVTNLTQNPK